MLEYWQNFQRKLYFSLNFSRRSPSIQPVKLLKSTEDSIAIAPSPDAKIFPKNLWKIVRNLPDHFHLLLTAIALASVSCTAIFTLIYASRSSLNCESKVKNTKWRTNRGTLTINYRAGRELRFLTGKYNYQNINKGKVSGNMSGELTEDILNFDWQETSELGKPQKGKGTLLFRNSCQDFFGNLSFGKATSGFANWQGNLAK